MQKKYQIFKKTKKRSYFMINQSTVGEQPQDNLNLGAEEQQTKTENVLGSPTQNNLSLSKFKTTEALEEAYVNLEKEFTQKCQKVKELTDKLNFEENMAKQNAIPESQKEGWQQKVATFYANNPEAKEFEEEISKLVSSDSKIASSKTPLEDALTKVKSQKYVPFAQLAKDKDFLDKYIFSNQQINKKIITDYLDYVASQQVMPLISSKSGAGTFASPVKKPQTLQDAGKMAEAYFKGQE